MVFRWGECDSFSNNAAIHVFGNGGGHSISGYRLMGASTNRDWWVRENWRVVGRETPEITHSKMFRRCVQEMTAQAVVCRRKASLENGNARKTNEFTIKLDKRLNFVWQKLARNCEE